MTQWLAVAQALHPDLPREQAERIAPILEALRTQLQPLAAALPFDAEPATTFLPEVPPAR